MRSRRIGSFVVVAGAVIAGCGGSSTKTLSQVQSCLNSAGYQARSAPPPAAGSVPGVTGPVGKVPPQLAVSVPGKPRPTAFTVTIWPTDKQASQMVSDEKVLFGSGGAGTGGGGVAKGRVAVSYARPQSAKDLDKVKSCAF